MKVTLTGAAGRLGSVVCRRLVEAGHDVRATDTHYRTDLPATIEVCDLLDREVPYRLLPGAEAVVHLANHPGVRGHDGQRCFNENVSMNMHVFEAARQCGVKKIIFASTIQTFTGHRPGHLDKPSALPYLPLDGDIPANPGNPYALSKHATEVMLQYFARQHGLSTIAVRFPFLVDPEWLPRFAKREGRRDHWIQGNLDEAFTYLPMTEAATLVDAILRADLPGFRTYFPAMPEPRVDMPVKELVQKNFATVPLRTPLDELTSLVDISRITRDTGWTPRPLAELAALAPK